MACEQDQSLIRRESAIPGLALLLDPERLRRRLLEQSGASAPGVLTAGYLRYKPGMNCIARYTISIDGETRFAYAKAFGEDARSKLGKVRERISRDRMDEESGSSIILDDEQILFSVFPHDAKLRSLAKLTHADSRNRLLERLFKSRPGWKSATISTLNYKPERRFVARFDNPDGESAVVKFYSRTEFARTREFRKHLEPTPGVRVPDWIGGSKNHRALAFSWLPGNTLREHPGGLDLDIVRETGRTIARFHGGRQHRFKPALAGSSIGRFKALAEDLAMILPELDSQARQMGGKLSSWQIALPVHNVPIHGDFYDKQVVVDDQGVSLIDSDNAHLGHPMSDLGCFVAHLERNAINGVLPADAIPDISAALLAGYREIAPEADFRELDMHTTFSLYQLIHNPFRDRVPDWPEQTSQLLDRCSDLMRSG